MIEKGTLHAGDRIQLRGPRGSVNSFTLTPGEAFHTNRGAILHDDIIGLDEGSVVATPAGIKYLVMRPLLSDFIMGMTRGAAIIYPKDSGQILTQADIGPGQVVIEAGVGSGALSLWLLRAIGATGELHSFERREEFANIAVDNVRSYYLEKPQWWHVHIGDLAEALPDAVAAGSADRALLDMLAPWETLEAVATALRPGGVLLCYVATVTQLSRTMEAIRDCGNFTEPLATETIVRDWHLDGLAVRPEHRMIGHTGFLLVTRRLADGIEDPYAARRADAKPEFSDADVEAWTPGAVGQRSQQGKRLRKSMRRAHSEAELRVEGLDS